MAFTFNPLWKTLINKNMNKEDLRKLISASPGTIAKLSKNEYVALRVVDDICNVLKVKSITEVMEFVSGNTESETEEYYDDFVVSDNTIIRESEHAEYSTTYSDDMKFLYDLLISFINSSKSEFSKEKRNEFQALYSSAVNVLPSDLQLKLLEQLIKSMDNKSKDTKE